MGLAEELDTARAAIEREDFAGALATLLARLTEVVVAATLGFDFSEADIERVEAALEKHELAHIRVPWPRRTNAS